MFYETGRHGEGLRWIDGWIAANQRTTFHAVHYSWHAALHELAMGDATAVRRRYLRELSPAKVQGVRELDRQRVVAVAGQAGRLWHGDLPIEEVLSRRRRVSCSRLRRRRSSRCTRRSRSRPVATRSGSACWGGRQLVDGRRDMRELVAPFAAAMAALVPPRSSGLVCGGSCSG